MGINIPKIPPNGSANIIIKCIGITLKVGIKKALPFYTVF